MIYIQEHGKFKILKLSSHISGTPLRIHKYYLQFRNSEAIARLPQISIPQLANKIALAMCQVLSVRVQLFSESEKSAAIRGQKNLAKGEFVTMSEDSAPFSHLPSPVRNRIHLGNLAVHVGVKIDPILL